MTNKDITGHTVLTGLCRDNRSNVDTVSLFIWEVTSAFGFLFPDTLLIFHVALEKHWKKNWKNKFYLAIKKTSVFLIHAIQRLKYISNTFVYEKNVRSGHHWRKHWGRLNWDYQFLGRTSLRFKWESSTEVNSGANIVYNSYPATWLSQWIESETSMQYH